MKVILLGELKGKGGEGDVVDVAQGFAENSLIALHFLQPQETLSSSRSVATTSLSVKLSVLLALRLLKRPLTASL